MDTRLTEIACVVDQSGSMDILREETIAGFNTFVAGQRAEPGDARLTLVLFNDTYEVVHESTDLDLVPPLTCATYVPNRTTALLDAVGRTVDDLGQRLDVAPEESRPGKVIVAILTDGLENASRTYTWPQISDMIDHQQNVYGWEFLFLGANQDAIATATRMSVPAANAHQWVAGKEGLRGAVKLMCCGVSQMRNGEFGVRKGKAEKRG